MLQLSVLLVLILTFLQLYTPPMSVVVAVHLTSERQINNTIVPLLFTISLN